MLSTRKFVPLSNVIRERSLTLFEKQLAYLMQTEKGAVLKLNSFFLFEYEQLSTKLGTTFKKYLLHSGRSIDSCNDAVYPLVKNINRISGVC